MAQPTTYTRQHDFSSELGTAHGTNLDGEFDAVKLSLDETLTNLERIQRDDGRLRNQSVHPDSFTTASLALMGNLNPRGLWTTATSYAVRDIVEQGGVSYVCGTAHTSSTFAAARALGYWTVMGADAVVRVTSLAALMALPIPTSSNQQAFMAYRSTAGDGAGGPFLFIDGDQSANVTADTQSGIWVAPTSASTGASGAWKRVYSGELNVKWFGATGNGTSDDATSIQAAMDYATVNHLKLIWSGTYLISAALTITNVSLWIFDGQGATLIQNTDNTPIFKFNFTTNLQQINSFVLENFSFDWTNTQPSTNTNSVAIAFATTTDNAWGIYSGVFNNLRCVKGYRMFGHTNATNALTVWGCTFRRIRGESGITGNLLTLRFSNGAGMPANKFDDIYCDATNMANTAIMDLSQCNSPIIDNYEVNNIADQRAVLLETCFDPTIGSIRIEGGSMTTLARALVETSSCRGARIGSIEVQNVTFNPGGGNFSSVFRDSSTSSGFLSTAIGTITTRSCTISSGTAVLLQSASAKVTLEDMDFSSNTGTFVPVYASDNSVYNCRIDVVRGRIGADAGNAATQLYVKNDTNGTSPETIIYNTPITADRAVTEPTTYAYPNLEYRVVRTAAATGAFNVNVGTGPLKALGIGSYCRIGLHGGTWRLLEYGTL